MQYTTSKLPVKHSKLPPKLSKLTPKLSKLTPKLSKLTPQFSKLPLWFSKLQDIGQGVVALQEGVKVVPHELHGRLIGGGDLVVQPTHTQLEVWEAGETVLLKQVPHRVKVL